MEIKKVCIQNFRKYLGVHEFDISKRITILYGPNGFGKSTFFDAIEWCLSGIISRFSRQKDFNEKDVLCFQCDSQNSVCSVEIEFEGHTLIRKFKVIDGVAGNVTAMIQTPSGRPIRGKSNVDIFLRKQFYQNSGRSMLGGLIKQTHILSQDQITDFISRDDAKGRFEALADIMGLRSVLFLLDNMKEVEAKLLSQKTKVTEAAANYNQMIEQRKKDIPTFDASKVKKWANLLHIPLNYAKVYESINLLQERLLSQSQILNTKIIFYENIFKLGYTTINDAKIQIGLMKEEMNLLSTQKEQANILQSRVNSTITTLSQRKDVLNKLLLLEEEDRTIRENLKEVDISEVVEISQILEEINLNRQSQNRLETALAYALEYQEITQDILLIPSYLTSLDKRIKRLERRYKRIDILRQAIVSRMSNQTDGVVTKLLSDVRGIYEYLTNHEHEGICPVCASYHGDELLPKVEMSIGEKMKLLQLNSALSQQLFDQDQRLETKLRLTKEQLDQAIGDRRMGHTRLHNGEARFEIITSLKMFDENIFMLPFEEIKHKNETIMAQVQLLERVRQDLINLQRVSKEFTRLKEEFGAFRLGGEEEVDVRLSRLQRASYRLQLYAQQKDGVYKKTNKDLNEIEKMLLQLPDENNEEELNQKLDTLVEQYQHDKLTVQNEYADTVSFVQFWNSYKRIKADVEMLNYDKIAREQEVGKYELKIEDISVFLKSAKSQLGSTALEYLNQSHSSIQKYFRYLNPLPSSLSIKFDGGHDELKIMVQMPSEEGKTLTNAQYTLSSGQLNVLAISIFLAINESQRVSILDFVAIDDPIQNMDDVNQFSICDVLGKLDKQILFATHDFDFVKLFVKKNEHQKENIQVYMIDSPSLIQEKVKRLTF
ncbi:AAA family ATPase [Paenibacillus polymyxa]|uniref:AAA family ATPase n=1 Tax=Paenibacillus polymyxa TaxID=1406 RepID=UPI001F0EA986|nr:AAA family ATPase [Paenibacillus polymyxa]UMR36093.1 AAA family ATPase [Paenibacillus polymyxa]